MARIGLKTSSNLSGGVRPFSSPMHIHLIHKPKTAIVGEDMTVESRSKRMLMGRSVKTINAVKTNLQSAFVTGGAGTDMASVGNAMSRGGWMIFIFIFFTCFIVCHIEKHSR